MVDGSNLGGVAGGLAGSRDAPAVVRWLLPWARSRARVILVFDGPRQADVAERYGPLEVRFAAPLTADETILRLLEREARGWTVVTDDAALARGARDLGARLLPATSLLARAAGGRKRRGAPQGEEKPTPSGAEQGYWKKVFSGES